MPKEPKLAEVLNDSVLPWTKQGICQGSQIGLVLAIAKY